MKNNNSKFTRIWVICILFLSSLCVYGAFSQTKETYSASDEDYILYGQWQWDNQLDISYFPSDGLDLKELIIDFKDGYGNSYDSMWFYKGGIYRSISYINGSDTENNHILKSDNNNNNLDSWPLNVSKSCDEKNGKECRTFYYDDPEKNIPMYFQIEKTPYSIVDFGTYGSLPQYSVIEEEEYDATCSLLWGIITYPCTKTRNVEKFYTDTTFYDWFTKNAVPINKCYIKNEKYVWTNIKHGDPVSEITSQNACENKNIKTITFNPRGGKFADGTTSNKNVQKKIDEYVTMPSVTKNGAMFHSWNLSDTAIIGGSKEAGENYLVPSSDRTFYAIWEYKTILNANGGTVNGKEVDEIKSVEFGYGVLPTASRAGYTFLGWYTEKNGGYKIENTTKPTGSVTLYAHWSSSSSGGGTSGASGQYYKGYFYPNGGKWNWYANGILINHEEEIAYSVVKGYPLNSSGSLVVERSGYTFLGWSTSVSGSVIDDISNYVPSGNIDFYAQWQSNSTGGSTDDTTDNPTGGSTEKYTITYDANGGSSVPASTSHNGSAQITTELPIYYGYMFSGWSKKQDCSTKKYNGGETISGQNITLYACWEEEENNKRCSVRNNPPTNDKYIFVLIALVISTIAYIYSYVIMKRAK